MKRKIQNIHLSSLVSGVIALVFSLVAVYIVYLSGIPFNRIDQALIAVGIASFLSGYFGRFFALKGK